MSLLKEATISSAKPDAPLERLQQLASPSFFMRVEKHFTGSPTVIDDFSKVVPVIEKEKERLRKALKVTPHLSGSLPAKLNLPGDVDVDFFVRAKSPERFKKLVDRLSRDPKFEASPYNKPGAGYHVFRRPAEGKGDLPVDLAVAYGAPAKEYLQSMKSQQRQALSIPEELRQQLIEKKHVLKHTPFDIQGKRYKAWKRDLDAALGGGYRLTRAPVEELTKKSEIVDLQHPEQAGKFKKFLEQPDVFGHRTHNIGSVLKDRGIISALEALKRGRLTSYEAGNWAGHRREIKDPALSKEHVERIEGSMFSASPDTSVFSTVAKETGRDATDVKIDFLRQRFHKVRAFLKGQDDPERMRKQYFAIPKLGPNIFVTKGGVLDSPGYGNSAVLFRNRAAKRSPFMNFVTDEHIIPAKDVLAPRKASIGAGYVLVPQEQLQERNKEHPDVKFIGMESIPEDIKSKLFKPLNSAKEVASRWVPAMMTGELSARQTR